MTDLINQVTAELQQKIEAFQPLMEIKEVGTVLECGDGIAKVAGLTRCKITGTGGIFKRCPGYCLQP